MRIHELLGRCTNINATTCPLDHHWTTRTYSRTRQEYNTSFMGRWCLWPILPWISIDVAWNCWPGALASEERRSTNFQDETGQPWTFDDKTYIRIFSVMTTFETFSTSGNFKYPTITCESSTSFYVPHKRQFEIPLVWNFNHDLFGEFIGSVNTNFSISSIIPQNHTKQEQQSVPCDMMENCNSSMKIREIAKFYPESLCNIHGPFTTCHP